ncbi:Uu.00g110900.m01.CDS01 [Anthostomella pinea]|uniref:Uu.00g110900.m01.CDS01 n=1 Tax=Anthostomella pinea TaxID=933095 RepID=A0AAI8V9U7_9PEZI|nr:Uu.00g110900.m01.CDS01 [Anthostomella pinea]
MEQPIGPQARPKSRPKANDSSRPGAYACEACRAAKSTAYLVRVYKLNRPHAGVRGTRGSASSEPVREPGAPRTHLGREYIFSRVFPVIFHLGSRLPRTSEAELPPPPPGPGKTFSIDFNMAAAEEPNADFDNLRQRHESFIADLVSGSDPGSDNCAMLSSDPDPGKAFSFNDLSSGATPSSSSTTTASGSTNANAANTDSSHRRRPIAELGIKPQFNLDSAAKLLASFRAMLPHFPCVVLPDDADVRSLARDSPFVLLAILAVTSCSTSLQGHSLYDEEFRKVLGLKFVAGGDRSLELLQGLLVYCSWYPFHLRPKNRQLFQYLRMAVDMVHDLELDQESDLNLSWQRPVERDSKIQNIRAFLACFYASSTYSWAWSKPTTLRYSSWITRCSDALEQASALEQDHVLVWLVRLQYILAELHEVQINARAFRDPQSEHYRGLIRMGLEPQLRDFQSRMPDGISTAPSIVMTSLSADMYLLAAPLLSTRAAQVQRTEEEPLDPEIFLAAAHTARAFLDYVAALPPEQMAWFSGADYTHFVVAVILAYRLSFPVASCPGYDFVGGRRVLDFGGVLRTMAAGSGSGNGDGDEDGDGGSGKGGRGKGAGEREGGWGEGRSKKKTDHVAALRVVLAAVRESFEKKSAALDSATAAATTATEMGSSSNSNSSSGGSSSSSSSRRDPSACPMLNGSLEEHLPLWAGQQGAALPGFSGFYTPQSGSRSGSTGVLTDPFSFSSVDNLDLDLVAMGQLGDHQGGGGGGGGKPPVVFRDLWDTMTTGWPAAGMDMGDVDWTAERDDVEYPDFGGL